MDREPVRLCPACGSEPELRTVSFSNPNAGVWQAVLDGPLLWCCVNRTCDRYLRPVEDHEPGTW